jgi:hypothetical protein
VPRGRSAARWASNIVDELEQLGRGRPANHVSPA